MSDFEALLQAYERSGGDPQSLQSPQVASLVVNGAKVLGTHSVPGINMIAEPLADGVKASIVVEPGTKVASPVHLCFGVLATEGVQRILADFEIGKSASVEFIAHCTFPNAIKVQHIMSANIHVAAQATMRYKETHYHGEDGGVEVLPKTTVIVDRAGRYYSEFNLNRGRAGKIDLDYEIDVDVDGIAELSTKAMGYANDEITVRETIRLNGENARSLAKSRIAVRDQAKSHIFSTTEGNAPFTKGHVDCVEIVRDQATASAVPTVRVSDDRAQVTHEAAIGTVDKKELETLMARGLDEEAAVDIIVRGMLGD